MHVEAFGHHSNSLPPMRVLLIMPLPRPLLLALSIFTLSPLSLIYATELEAEGENDLDFYMLYCKHLSQILVSVMKSNL